MTIKVGRATGTCPRCGKHYALFRPIDYVVCDCYKYCPEDHGNGFFGTPMTPFTPDLTPPVYGPIINYSGTAWGDLDKPMKILFVCSVCNYHSAQTEIEVELQ